MTIDFSDTLVAGPEIAYAEKVKTYRLRTARRQLRAYVSSHYGQHNWPVVEDGDSLDDAPENAYFDTVALMTPRLAFSNPTSVVRSRRIGPTEEIATAMTHGIRQWISCNEIDELAAEWAVDFEFAYPVCHISMAECPLQTPDNHQVLPRWPEVNRISPWDCFRDPSAKSPREIRYVGHRYLIDKEDLVELAEDENEEEDAGWDLEAIEAVPEGQGDEKDWRGTEGSVPDRKQIMVKEVWVPGYEDEDHPGSGKGFHGTTFYYGYPPDEHPEDSNTGDDPIMIREPQPFYGPEWGPYQIGSTYYVPDEPYGVTPMVANAGAIEDMNDHANAISGSMRRYKRLVLVDDADPEVADKIEYAEHDLVIKVPGLHKAQVVNLDVGGASKEWLNYFGGVAKPRVDRQLGMSEMMRGAVSGGASATENALAEQNSETRIAWPKNRFRKFVQSFLTSVAWYFYHEEDLVVPLGPEAAVELGGPPDQVPVYRGGFAGFNEYEEDDDEESFEEEYGSFADLELVVEILSMEHTSESTLQRRALQTLEIITGVARVAPASPFIDWEKVLKIVGDGLNLPHLADVFKNKEYGEAVGLELAERTAALEPRLGSQARAGQGGAQARPSSPTPFAGQSTGSILGNTTGRDGAPAGGLRRVE